VAGELQGLLLISLVEEAYEKEDVKYDSGIGKDMGRGEHLLPRYPIKPYRGLEHAPHSIVRG